MSEPRDEPVIDLGYVGQAPHRLIGEVPSLGDDMHVLTAIVQRPDNSRGRVLEELRAMHRQHSRLANGVSQLKARE